MLDSIDTIMKQVSDDRCGGSTVFIGNLPSGLKSHYLHRCFDYAGTTRNSFQGKVVTKLEYQGKSCEIQTDHTSITSIAYTKLALNTFSKIVSEAQSEILRSEHHAPSQEKPLLRVALHHRIGTVKIGEPSISKSIRELPTQILINENSNRSILSSSQGGVPCLRIYPRGGET